MKIFAAIVLLICAHAQFTLSAGESSTTLDTNKNVEMSPNEKLANTVNNVYKVKGNNYYRIRDTLAEIEIPSVSANDFVLLSSSTVVGIKEVPWIVEQISHSKKVLLEKAKSYDEN